MSTLAHRQEIMAEDVEDAPGALWARADLDKLRLADLPDSSENPSLALATIAVAVDPSATATGDECGIVVGGIDRQKPHHGYVLADRSKQASPDQWALAVLQAYVDFEANKIIYEANQGGDMVRVILLNTIKAHPELGIGTIKIEAVTASKGKRIRAEPISVLYEQGRVHHVGSFPYLEDELCQWCVTDSKSPNRLDAAVWLLSSLMLKPQGVLLR
jgi:phage terminase large subunit-like protein